MSRRRVSTRSAVFAAAGVALTLVAATVTTAASQEPALAAGSVAKPLTAEQTGVIEAQIAADHADWEATERMRAESAAEAARIQQEQAAAAAAEQARQEAIANAVADPRAAARQMLADRGLGDDQFQCLDRLWTKESNWTVSADNPTSSAYGIPQALPGNKMASAGADWETNPATQITWGLGYIAGRYGDPCGAWAHHQLKNWY